MENYFEYKGVYFRNNTPLKLCDILLNLYTSKERIVLDYGDIETKRSWGEIYDITGYIGKSTGTKPILILVYSSRSIGGGAISTDSILSIKSSKGKRVVYSV